MKIKVSGIGQLTLTDQDYHSSGGEAEVYLKNDVAYKIYHNPAKMIPEKKIRELQLLNDRSNIITPKQIVYDLNDSPIGFGMTFIHNAEPICKLFTNSFKNNNNITEQDVNSLIQIIQDTIDFIHRYNCVIVDLNELNLLVPDSYNDVFFIDVDSYQTPSFRATAIMNAVRDPLVTNNQWSFASDWFAFAVVSFQLWIGIHPYKGSHPSYNKKEWLQRMQDGVSIFDPQSTLPRMCNSLDIIPTSHYEWLKAVFTKNERCSPPKMGDLSAVIISSLNVSSVSAIFEQSIHYECDYAINYLLEVMGVKYVVSDNCVFKENAKLAVDISDAKKTVLCSTAGMNPIVVKLVNDYVHFFDTNGTLVNEISATDLMTKNASVYTVFQNKLFEHSFFVNNCKTIVHTRLVCNVMENSVRMYDGVLFQSMMKKLHAIIPYEKGKCSIIHLSELDNSRIVGAKCEKNICIVLCEKDKSYNRYCFTFNNEYTGYVVRIDSDVSYSEINFTVLPNGITVLSGVNEVDIFKDNNIKKIDNPPFTPSTKLYNKSGTVYYIDNKTIHQVSILKQ